MQYALHSGETGQQKQGKGQGFPRRPGREERSSPLPYELKL